MIGPIPGLICSIHGCAKEALKGLSFCDSHDITDAVPQAMPNLAGFESCGGYSSSLVVSAADPPAGDCALCGFAKYRGCSGGTIRPNGFVRCPHRTFHEIKFTNTDALIPFGGEQETES